MSQWLSDKWDDIDADGNPLNALNNKALLRWIDQYFDPGNTLIQINGGEPGLYPEINELLTELDTRGYEGLVLTNGSLPIISTKKIKRVAAWHCGHPRPIYYDLILLLDNPNDSELPNKINSGLPYYLLPFLPFYNRELPMPINTRTNTLITEMTNVYSSGRMSDCFVRNPPPFEMDNIFKMSVPTIKQMCPLCGSTGGFEIPYLLLKDKGEYDEAGSINTNVAVQ
jgi:hypothetical protein